MAQFCIYLTFFIILLQFCIKCSGYDSGMGETLKGRYFKLAEVCPSCSGTITDVLTHLDWTYLTTLAFSCNSICYRSSSRDLCSAQLSWWRIEQVHSFSLVARRLPLVVFFFQNDFSLDYCSIISSRSALSLFEKWTTVNCHLWGGKNFFWIRAMFCFDVSL